MEEDENNLSYSSEDIDQLLRCAVCLDKYKHPKVLPCQHTFCESPCLEGLVNYLSLTIKCPECRAEHRVPYQGVRAFPNNLTIRNFLDIRKRVRRLSGDNRATADEPAASRVPHESSNSLGASGFNRSFEINAVNPPVEPLMAAASRPGCAACSRDVALSRCAHCSQIVCDSCRRNHIEHVKLDVARLLGQIRRGTPRITDVMNSLERKTHLMKERAEAAKAEVDETIERFVMELRARQRVLHNGVDVFFFNEVRNLRGHQENLEVELASITSFCDSMESSLSRSRARISDDDLVDMKRQCVEHMETLRSYDAGSYQPPRERQLQLFMEENRLSNMISNFGEIVSNQSPPTSDDPSASSSRDSSPMVSSSVPTSVPTSGSVPELATSRVQTFGRIPTTQSLPSLMSTTTTTTTPSNRHSVDSDDADFNYQRRNIPGQSTNTSDVPRDNTRNRRTLQQRRRQHMTESRIGGIMGGGGGPEPAPIVTPRAAGLLERRANRSLSTGAMIFDLPNHSSRRGQESASPVPEERAPPPSQPASRQAEAAAAVAANRRTERSNTFTREDTSGENNDTASRVSSADMSRTIGAPVRPPVRFDVTGDEDEDGIGTFQLPSFTDNQSISVAAAVNNYQDKGRAIVRFGRRGQDPMDFNWPRGVAATNDDNILVADSSNHRVQVFDRVGRFVTTFGSYGQNDGEFDCLAGVAVNPFRQIIVSDRYNHRIQIFDHHGDFQRQFGEEGTEEGQLLYPWGVACDTMGFIYVCDKENHRIQVFQTNGNFVRAFGSLGHRSGRFENPHFLALGRDNRVYVSDTNNHRVQVFSMYGDFLFSFGSAGTVQGQMRFPKGIAIDEQGFVIIADSGNNRIQVFRGDGRFYSMFGTYGDGNGQFKGLEGVAVLKNGNIVVSDRENHRVQIF